MPSLSSSSTVLRGATVCCTGAEPGEREHVRKKTVELGGHYTGDFTKRVTHLVAHQIIGSEKYLKAKELGVAVVKPAWMDEVWERSRMGSFRLQDMSEKHACPLFHNVKACLTELSHDQRDAFKVIIEEQGGGRVMKELSSACDVLITLNQPRGFSAKYEWAAKWGVSIVVEQWVHDSLSAGRLLLPKAFAPTLPAHCDIPFSLTDFPGPIPQYLADCRVYLCCPTANGNPSSSDRLNILRRLVILAGGLRLSTFEPEECTHWVVTRQSMSSESLDALRSALGQSPGLIVVHDNWLVDCYKVGQRLDEEKYQYAIEDEKRAAAEPSAPSPAAATPFRIPSQRRSLSQPTLPVESDDPHANKPVGSQLKRMLGSKLKTFVDRLDDGNASKENAHGTGNSAGGTSGSIRPLTGCTIAVSTRLWHRRAELHLLVTELGGSFVYTLDRHCSHLIHSGTTRSDPSRDIADARSLSICIVAPEWLGACKSNGRRMAEQEFPFFPHAMHETPSMHVSQLDLLSIPTQLQPPRELVAPAPPSQEPSCRPQHYFCFTGLNDADKKKGSRWVSELGGQQAPLESPAWDPLVTHLISGRPSRSEKYLSAMASGAWILDMAFLEACATKTRFGEVSEEDYEMGRDSLPGKPDLAAAGRRWRLALSPIKGRAPTRGAFTGWRILLVCGDDRKRLDGFIRLLEAGGALVYTLDDPVLPDPMSTTHLLLSSPSLRSRIKNDWLVHFDEAKIHTTEYIAEYLMNPP